MIYGSISAHSFVTAISDITTSEYDIQVSRLSTCEFTIIIILPLQRERLKTSGVHTNTPEFAEGVFQSPGFQVQRELFKWCNCAKLY
jgi:hypothetical protein